MWSLLVLAVLLRRAGRRSNPSSAGVGIAAGAGVACGLLIAYASTEVALGPAHDDFIPSWSPTSCQAPAALRASFGFLPTSRTLQVMV